MDGDISKFWVVWNPEGRSPTYRHFTKKSAQDEAERLANQCPGQTFTVLAAVDAYRAEVSPAKAVKIARPKPEADDGIPF